MDIAARSARSLTTALLAALLLLPTARAAETRNLALAAPGANEQKIALVIGNSAYPSAALKNPVNDAKAMAAKLTSLGFEVILRTDSNLRDMTRAVSQFGQKLKGGSVGLFYFAGHGMQVRGKNFLIPVDAEIENEASTRSEAVDVDQLLEQLGNARLSMVILDACRNNPFERRFRSTGNGGLAQIDAPTGTLLAYATAPGKVAYDGTGANGLYTTELLKALDTPGLTVENVFKQVRINVLKSSDNQQIPWESSSLTGEFYFKPDTRPPVAGVDAQQLARERAEFQKTLEEERRRREQDSKVQADLQRSLEEERRRRDQDAELVKREMENLRKELLALRQPVAPPPKPEANSTPTPAPPVQVALAVTDPQIASASPARNAEWAPRVAQLEQMKGRLSFAKAFAILLDVSSGGDLEELVRFENRVKREGWASAHAMGIDSQGTPYWTFGGKFGNVPYARDTVVEFCEKSVKGSCRIIHENHDFQEKGFFELVNQFRSLEPAAARSAILDSFRKPPVDTSVANGGGRTTGRTFNVDIFSARR